MKNLFQPGDVKEFRKVVNEADAAAFESGVVHAVYSTFALARDAEWTCRLFVLEMKDDDEEGIGTFVNVRHHSPAPIGSEVRFEAIVENIEGNAINCRYTAHVGNRLIAEGQQGQKILKRNRLERLMEEVSIK